MTELSQAELCLLVESLNTAVAATMQEYLKTKVGSTAAVAMSKKAYAQTVLRDKYQEQLNAATN